MIKQITLSELSDELAQRKTKKKEFLNRIDRIVPWGEWLKIVEPHYYKGERGNKPYDKELMLRLYLLQNLYNLSDMQTAEQVIDSRAFSDFCSISSPEEVPDGDTIGRFRNLLIKARVQKMLFAQVITLLRKKKEHQKSYVRAKVEHILTVDKNLFSFRKTRYRGKRKQFAKLNFLFAVANLYLADRRFGLSV